MSARVAGILLGLLIGCAAAAPAPADVKASLDASQIATGDTVQLTLEHDGRTSGQPDLTPLRQDFDILGTSSSTSIELFNGSASEKTEVVLTLAPKATGILTIPSLSWGGEQSRPLTLTVTGPGGAGQPGTAGATPAAKVFIETSASPEQPYVEAVVHLTVRLFTSEMLYHADLEMPESGAVVVKQVGADQSGNTERNGQTYRVITRQYVLFPLHSGKLTLQGPVLNAEVAVNESPSGFGNSPFGGFFGGLLRTVRPITVQGDPLVLSVQPRPAGAVGSYWLPASDVALNAAWNPTRLSAPAGDPITLDIDLRATGLTAAQLPDLSSLLSVPSGLKSYPDQPKLVDSMQDGKLVGDRDQTVALMADSPGHYTIPALTVKWWDTLHNQPRTVTLPARTLSILPPPGSTTASVSATPASAPLLSTAQPVPPATASRHAPAPVAAQKQASAPAPWKWISIGLAVIWLATLGAWFWSRSGSRRAHAAAPGPTRGGGPPGPRQPPPDPAKERAAFRAACEANDARAARAHLIAWAAALWGSPPAGINAVAARISDTTVAELLRDLDRACYAGGGWQGSPLAAALADLPVPPGRAGRRRGGLAPLYP